MNRRIKKREEGNREGKGRERGGKGRKKGRREGRGKINRLTLDNWTLPCIPRNIVTKPSDECFHLSSPTPKYMYTEGSANGFRVLFTSGCGEINETVYSERKSQTGPPFKKLIYAVPHTS